MRLKLFFTCVFVFNVFQGALWAQEQQKYWFFFTDKGQSLSKSDFAQAKDRLSERAIWRRQKVTPPDQPVVDMTDLPVHENYIRQLQDRGIEPVVISRWLNAMSGYATRLEAEQLASLPFVEKIQRVAIFRRPPIPPQPQSELIKPKAPNVLDYGPSFEQSALVNIPKVHAIGVTGKDVIIAVMDTGFLLDHKVFDNTDVIATFDFIHGDDNVDYEAHQDSRDQPYHGTAVLSILAGYDNGTLIGPAFDASFLLAKTEELSSETPAEEDYWIAAAEWAEVNGADIINTSLGYMDWYEYEDMDGDAAPITIAADMAAQKGIVVVSSAGNEGNTSWRYITAPADGDSVIAVGAVNSDSVLAGFSSVGPTFDGRIKPDVVAMGVNSVHATLSGSYSRGSGTSFSAPIVSGVAALILSAHPELTPMQVRQALIQTADRVRNPDNMYGFGLVDAFKAVNYYGPVIEIPDTTNFVKIYPNPYLGNEHDNIHFVLNIKELTDVRIDIYNVFGQKVAGLERQQMLGKEVEILWPAYSPAGVYIFRVILRTKVQTGKFTIL